MKVFITGASGFIGSAIVSELLNAGHQVVGLARSDAAATAIAASGAAVLRGSLTDFESLQRGAAAADGVIHTAFIHDFANFAASAATDEQAIAALGAALAGSNRPLIVTTGTAGIAPGRLLTEDDTVETSAYFTPRVSEQAGLALVAQGVRASVLRLPPSVYGAGDHGFVPQLIAIAREKGVSAYPGDGTNRWPTVHRFDAAKLYRLALEAAPAGTRLHAVGDEGVSARAIAEMIGRQLDLPVVALPLDQASGHFGFLGGFFALDIPASSQLTQQRFGWQPSQPGLLADLALEHYFELAG